MSNIDMILLSVMAILMLLCVVVSMWMVAPYMREKKEEEEESNQVKGKTQFISPVDVQEVYKESEEVGDFINKLE
jgi:heme/copper-type cytochrome/quinol oxidase subunit 2